MEEAGVSLVIRGLRVVEVPDRTRGEEQAEERTRAADADGERPGRERGLEPRRQRSPPCVEPRVRVEATRQVQGRDAGGDGDGVPAQGPGLVDGPDRRELLHQVAPAAERGAGEAAAHHLAERRQVGRDAAAGLRAAVADPEPGDDLVEDQQRVRARARARAGLRGSPARAGPRPCSRRPARRSRRRARRRARRTRGPPRPGR